MDLSPSANQDLTLGEITSDEYKVLMVDSGSFRKDEELAAHARRRGYLVFLKSRPEDSDIILKNARFKSGNDIYTFPIKVSKPSTIKHVGNRLSHLALRTRTRTEIIVNLLSIVALLILGHLLFSFFTYDRVASGFTAIIHEKNFGWYVLGGFVAQLIDGALGMAYGVTATTLLMTAGVAPSAASASVHTSEIFTSGVSGYMHLRFGNVNSKLFKHLLIPGVLGAIIGSYALTNLEQYMHIVRGGVAAYTLTLGLVIIKKALMKQIKKRPVKRIGWLAAAGGLLDSVGGGGWGPIVSSTLIARGRHPRYTIGSVNLVEFFVSLASSITFVTLIGFSHWQVIVALMLGGMAAAPIAARLAGKLPLKAMMLMVGILVIVVSIRNIFLVIG